MRSDSIRHAIVALALLALAADVAAQKVSKEALSSGGQDRTYYKFVPDGADQVPLLVLLHGSGRDNTVAIDGVRQVRDYLVGKGFKVKLTEMPNDTHDYYSRASDINRAAWLFLKAHQLPADPKFKEYVIAK